MGLTNEEHEEMRTLMNAIAEVNGRSAEKIKGAYQDLLSTPIGTGAAYHGVKIVNIRNVTQDDGDGGTGDIILILADGQEKSVSICQGTQKRNGNIEKCLSNPSCTRYGCDDNDVIFLKEIASSAVTSYKDEMKAAYGENEDDWPSRVKTRAASAATALASGHTIQKFNTQLSPHEKIAVFEDLLRVKAGSKPADMLCLVNEGCTRMFLFDINGLNPACTWAPSLQFRDPCFMEMYLGDVLVGETQVKFNNGVYHKGKTSSLTSSWNATAVMNKVFDLSTVSL